MKLLYIRHVLAIMAAFVLFTSQAFAADDYCYKGSYGRGVGTIPDQCNAKEKDAGLCYNKCNATYYGVGPVCWQSCPSGYVDTGALCHIDKALTNGGSWVCTKKLFGKCIWKSHECGSGYTNTGFFCALNTPSVPAGYKGLTGLDLTKGTYGRGVGTIPVCASDKQADAGLCYNGCKTGYNGIGPVCWNTCPAGHSACGAGCATSSAYCAEVTGNQVFSTVMLAVNVATLGSSGEAEAAGESAEEMSRAEKAIADAKASWAELKASKNYQTLVSTAKGASYAHKMEVLATAQTTAEALKAMSGFDPTGISEVASAYSFHVCNN
jgi:hypothetical protein